MSISRTLVLIPGFPAVILNNFFGRQFNSLNDVAYHRPTGDLFFTDVTYGFVSPRQAAPTAKPLIRIGVVDTGFPTESGTAEPSLPIQRNKRYALRSLPLPSSPSSS